MKKKVVIFILLIFSSFTLAYSQNNDQLTSEHKTWLSKANRHEKNGWIYLHIEGNPEERGFQHGYMLSKEIKESIRIFSKTWEYETAMKWSWFVAWSHIILTPKTDPENLAEIDGIVEGMKAAGVSTTWSFGWEGGRLKNGKTNVICCALGSCLRNTIRSQKIS